MEVHTSTAIAIENLHAQYGHVTAVNGISLNIRAGECFGLLGPNGAGKTTTLSCVEGIKNYQEGRILIDGIDVRKEPARAKRLLGVQLQLSSLFPDLTATEIVQFYSSLYNVFLKRAQVQALLERFDLADKAKAKIGQLSGGQQHRLTLALSIAHNPSILLLDEPTTGLDPQARRTVWSTIRQLRKEGKTIILTTHYIEEAEMLCQRVGIIDKGVILALGSPQELIQTMGNLSTVLVTMQLSDENVRTLSEHALVGSISYDAPQLTIQTQEPQQLLALLDQIGKDTGNMPQDMTVRRPNLEDVFLSLTGRALGLPEQISAQKFPKGKKTEENKTYA